MNYTKFNTAVNFTKNVKESALYFDHVVPLIPTGEKAAEMESTIGIILPPPLKENIASYQFYIGACYLAGSKMFGQGDSREEKVFREGFEGLCSHIKLFSHPIISNAPRHVIPTDNPCPMLSLMGLQLVDVSDASWEKILEFRQDKDSCNKFRNLRLFLNNTFYGKSSDLVEDNLLKCIEDYENTIQTWGFKRKVATLNAILTSKSLIASGAGALAGLVLNEPLVTSTSLSAGAIIETGKISLKLAESNQDKKDIINNYPLAYIIDAKNKFDA